MKKLLLLLLLIPNLVIGEDTYKFEQFNLNGNLTQQGKVTALEKDINNYKFEVDVTGVNNGYEFTSSHKVYEGLNIWDIHDRRDSRGISIFTWNIDPKKYSVGFESTDIETLHKRHPYFKSQSWIFITKVKKQENLTINDKTYETIYFHTHGERPSGPTGSGGCYFGQTGVIEVSSWYDRTTGKLIKQIFDKRHCKPEEHRLLTREILTIQ